MSDDDSDDYTSSKFLFSDTPTVTPDVIIHDITSTRPIPKSNIGYQLLHKSGYTDADFIEPIHIVTHKKRLGLGIEEMQREEFTRKMPKLVEKERSVNEFKEFKMDQHKRKRVARDVEECMRVMEEFGKEWNEEGLEAEGDDLLKLLLERLRTESFYCIYCGVKYLDEQDMEENCPGMNREDH